MNIDPNHFLHAITAWLAGRVQGGLRYAQTPRQIWRLAAVEDTGKGQGVCGDPYSVLMPYPGPGTNWDPQPRTSIQVRTTGSSAAAVLDQAWKIYNGLLDDVGHPLRMIVIPALVVDADAENWTADGSYTLVSVDLLQCPGIVGRDEDNRRATAFFNFEVGFFRN